MTTAHNIAVLVAFLLGLIVLAVIAWVGLLLIAFGDRLLLYVDRKDERDVVLWSDEL